MASSMLNSLFFTLAAHSSVHSSSSRANLRVDFVFTDRILVSRVMGVQTGVLAATSQPSDEVVVTTDNISV